MNKLIQKAQEKKVKRKKFTKDEIELALTYIKGELTVTQVCHAIGIDNRNNTSTVYQFVTQALRQHYSK